MGTILKFPVKPGHNVPLGVDSKIAKPSPARSTMNIPRVVFAMLVKGFWVLTLLLWPILRWLIAIDVAFYGFMTALAWDDPTKHYGMKFVLHLLVFSALTYFVTYYKPKNN